MNNPIMPEEDVRVLHAFLDAIAAGHACEYLELDEIPFLVEDVSEPMEAMRNPFVVPALQLELLVRQKDLERARSCLRQHMSLFPEREDDVVEHGDDGEEVLSQAVACETSEDAEAVQIMLSEVGIWSTVQRIVDEEDMEFVTYSVEVKGKDVEKATAAVERWAELP